MTAPLRHRAREAWLGGAVLAAVTVAAALFDPTRPGRFPSCPFRAVTGWDCPGCGSLRALHALTHGDVVAAVDYNALLVGFLPFGAVIWLRAVTGRFRPRVLPVWAARALAATVVLWAVIRNLPLFGGVLAS
ncbi:hypothetical protein SGFS_001890 [Streptomyces graminofaciens]|uniref:DUF2752 domain-containing protein n=1 Tax=Streptomyces graminofaciens TaxID=68212 RepID=A0ABN5V6F1_9ACTN|nr:DUF2752 domain-containing protein [Streptomyces graminofaciens]BBC28898.1 hypothetical protein SGFS_001890 [Streptomyces graminofaciens]